MCGTFLLALLAVVFPPLPVWVKRGICSVDSLINIALCCLGFLPGLLHAWYIIAKYPEEPLHRYQLVDAESGLHHPHPHQNGSTVYVYTATYPSAAAHTQPRYAPHPQASANKKQGNQNYGTTNANNNNSNNSNKNDANAANGPQFLPSVTPATENGNADAGEGGSSSQQQPPSYHEAIQGDYKVQTHD